ncbi:MAG: Asp-tRNA(Asn)/Glu-tRNA(Gln) amidotransferase subunit GatB [Chloroflexi bacterium]|nr:Asp-tRNA(Asn)/Glu-tRNA(Gln) amidotransferase subunit GatB [Chloroflexota bacterium]
MTLYEPVIGLEVHAELLTQSKMFCGCAVVDSTQAEPNTVTCPVCTAMPGVLPVVNRRAVEFAMMAALALHCEIRPQNVFARKNYFYPDLPKGYQISQYELPLAVNGYLDIESAAGRKRVGVRRVHLEEDTGKLYHIAGASLVDYNRSGVPLMEIVSEPDLHSVEDVRLYAEGLRAILRYLGVNNGDMEKGVIRFEANISVRLAGSDRLNTRTEVKNLNSFRALVRAAEYEIARQSALLARGEAVVQQTLGWDEAGGQTVARRGKEEANDYRYFPEPDLPPLAVSRDWVEGIRAQLPELPEAKRQRFEREFGLSSYDADLLTRERAVAEYFEQALAAGGEPKAVANWMLGELFRVMKEQNLTLEQIKIAPAHIGQLAALVADGTLSSTLAKEVFAEMVSGGAPPAAIVQARGLAQISDAGRLREVIHQVIADNPKPVADYLGGKDGVLKFLIGQAMRATRGKANPQLVGELMRAALDARRS